MYSNVKINFTFKFFETHCSIKLQLNALILFHFSTALYNYVLQFGMHFNEMFKHIKSVFIMNLLLHCRNTLEYKI